MPALLATKLIQHSEDHRFAPPEKLPYLDTLNHVSHCLRFMTFAMTIRRKQQISQNTVTIESFIRLSMLSAPTRRK